MSEQPAGGLRADVWLWAARFFRTRALAKQAIEGGKVVVNQAAIAKCAKTLHVGDVLVVQRGEERLEVTVLGLSDQRGPASVAQGLYAETAASHAAREVAREQRRLDRAGFQPPQGKPDKRARRLIRALGDIEML
ncbi:MAG TPA: S4 domain-containing protein [Rhodanobacteraceae bacterium]|nr:S4 domain-containing protein [Rhodanobacteraceae bacterium]